MSVSVATSSPDAPRRLSVLVPVFNERYLVEELLGRILAVSPEGIDDVELIVIDDASTDGTGELLDRLSQTLPFQLLRHPVNRGKGAALRTGIKAASGDYILFQDADLEYDPADYSRLLRPLLLDGADVVYGSRFLSAERRRVLYFRHTLGNRLITLLSNLTTDLNLTDIETCYKAFHASLLKSIPLRSNDFTIEVEITAKIAKRRLRVFEVPVSYLGRTYQEGKKIGWRDGVRAIWAIFRFWLEDDIYGNDEYGSHILHSLERTRRFNHWMASEVGKNLGEAPRVLEIGAGIGNITNWLIPRPTYVASDINPHYLHYLKNFSDGKPYLSVCRLDLESSDDFSSLQEQFDAAICLNVLEHVRDPLISLKNINFALGPGGRLVLYVPQDQRLYSKLDEALGHRCRYSVEQLEDELRQTGFRVASMSHFNRFSRLGWWWNCKIRGRTDFSRFQLKAFDLLVPALRRLDRFLPWRGLGLLAVAIKVPEPQIGVEE